MKTQRRLNLEDHNFNLILKIAQDQGISISDAVNYIIDHVRRELSSKAIDSKDLFSSRR